MINSRCTKLGALFVFSCSQLLSLSSSFSFTRHYATIDRLSPLVRQRATASSCADDEPLEDKTVRNPYLSRRYLLQTAVFIAASLPFSVHAVTKEQQEDTPVGLLSASRVADLLHKVPTFTLVDQKGVPFMVVGEDARVTGYFFTSYQEADRILRLARTSANKTIRKSKKEPKQNTDELTNPWNKARISTVPLDTAVTLVTKSSSYVSRKGGGGNYFQVAPSEADVQDALSITGKSDLQEGKVPLFYYEDFVLNNQSPLFFRKAELEKAFRAAHPDEPLPPMLVTELFAVLTEMVKPGGTDEEIKTLVFVPPAESAQRARECERRGGKEASYLLGQRNVVL